MARPISTMVDVKPSEIKKLLKDSTLAEVAAKYGVTITTLYNRFGDTIRGLNPRGRRVGTAAKPKAKSKKAPAKAVKKTKKAKAVTLAKGLTPATTESF